MIILTVPMSNIQTIILFIFYFYYHINIFLQNEFAYIYILKNLSSFSNEGRVSFIDFLKELSRSRDFCCWSNSLFQSLGPRDETENFV